MPAGKGLPHSSVVRYRMSSHRMETAFSILLIYACPMKIDALIRLTLIVRSSSPHIYVKNDTLNESIR